MKRIASLIAVACLAFSSPVMAADEDGIKSTDELMNEINQQHEQQVSKYKKLDDKYGFKNFRFETAPPKSGLRLTESAGDMKYYSAGMTSVGRAPGKLTVGYYKNKLQVVLIEVQGFTNVEEMQRVLEEAYGTPDQPNQFMKDFYWFGQKVDLALDRNEITDKADIIMTSKKMIDLEKSDAEKRARKAADQL